jgi:hypothetical protein
MQGVAVVTAEKVGNEIFGERSQHNDLIAVCSRDLLS